MQSELSLVLEVSPPRTLSLPGAENFAAFLGKRSRGKTYSVGPYEYTVLENRIVFRVWEVFMGDSLIGKYTAEPDNFGDVSQSRRKYEGRVPGYFNKSIIVSNATLHEESERRLPNDLVSLGYGVSESLVYFDTERRKSKGLILQRSDGHKRIPFP